MSRRTAFPLAVAIGCASLTAARVLSDLDRRTSAGRVRPVSGE
jgi:hypothetical protein